MVCQTLYRAFGCCCAVLLLAACATTANYDRLKEAAPEAGDFSHSLAAEYLDYAGSQLELGHAVDADYFGIKGLQALDGGAVAPEILSSTDRGELVHARQWLISLLTDDVKYASPEQAARAQLLYDCWAHQQKQLAEGQHAPCASEFYSVAEDLEAVAASFVPSTKRKFIFQFSALGSELDQTMNRQLNQVAAILAGLDAKIVLHAVPYGYGGRYQDVVEARLYVLRGALIDRQISANNIIIQNGLVGKTVYLSHDQGQRPKNSITLRIKTSDFSSEETP